MSVNVSDDPQIRLDEFLPFRLAVVANQVSQKIAKIIEKDFQLHIPEWRILATLSYHAPVSSQFLVTHTAMDPARVSRAQTRLTDLGLVSVRQDPDDKRRVLVSLTEFHGALCGHFPMQPQRNTRRIYGRQILVVRVTLWLVSYKTNQYESDERKVMA